VFLSKSLSTHDLNLGSLDVEQGLDVTLLQVLGPARTLLDADRVGLMLIDQAGALGWASASDRVVTVVAGDLTVPVQVGGSPVGTLAARSAGSTPVQMARAVVAGAPLPSDRLAQARVQRREATDLAVAVHPPGLGIARGSGPTIRAARPAWPSPDRTAPSRPTTIGGSPQEQGPPPISAVGGEITHRPVAAMQAGQRVLQVGQLQLLDHALDQLGLADRC
jgi:hypothetical protein